MSPTYPNLANAVRGVCEHWCQTNGYSDAFLRNGEWWAFPANSVMPVCLKDVIPSKDKYAREVNFKSDRQNTARMTKH